MPSVVHPVWRIAPLEAQDVVAVGAALGLGLARLDQGDGCYLVAWDDTEPVGHVHVALTDPAELQDLAVAVGHRRRGVASALVAAAEADLRARGRDVVALEVSVEDDAAQALYRRCGYADSGRPPRRVVGTITIRTGPIEVDDTLATWTKRLA